uniref:ABC transporter domain-containing protein n=1 Tax=Glossina morsitans morsitans TaxID=37546 RepID=A0A1B0FB44_GLOMM
MPATFGLLLRKNFCVERAAWKWSIVELLSLGAVLAVIVANPVTRVKYSFERETVVHSDLTYNQPGLYDLSVFMHLMSIRKERMRMTLLYTPKNNFTRAVVNGAKIALNLHDIEDVEDNDTLENYFSGQNNLAGIVFHNVDDGAVPEKLVVSLRFPGLLRTVDGSNNLDDRLWTTRCSGIISPGGTGVYGNVDLYLREGFLQLQHSLYVEWIKLLKNSDGTSTNRGRNKENELESVSTDENGDLRYFHPNDDDIPKEDPLITDARLNDLFVTRDQDLRQIQNEELPLIPHIQGEITVILGAEDNGRVSLLCLMAGWQKPELGDIYYDGNKSIYQHWSDYRSRIDIYMHQSSIFDSLSVKSTLTYFGRIKQSKYNREELEREVNKWLLLLSGKISPGESVKNLSYGEKRLLVLCCTLFGNTSIVLLHEPTQFMKYEDQQMFWQILQQEKEERAIIVTTSSIDEAEWFADRIGILDDGVLLAYGSPFFLKTRFGIGCDLIILKDPNRSSGPITEIINKFVPNAVPDNQVGDLLLYKLPTDKRSIYQRMLLQLEDASENLGIKSIRVSSSELGEVFMTLGMESTLKPTVPDITQTLKFINESEDVLKRQQIRAMLYKKMIHQTLNIVPVIMTFGLLFLILLTNHLFSLVKIPKTMETGIHLGISKEETSADKFEELKDCNYIQIDGVDEEKLSARKTHLQYLFYGNLKCGNMSHAGLGTVSYPLDDDDVVKERMRIAKMCRFECKRYSVLADQIEKKIPNHGKRLNTVSFALDKYMSMGIYGCHKAGKTHLIEQLAGARGFRFGELYIEKVDFKFENNAAIKLLGFCPQKSGLGMVFSPRQLFTMLFMIRGVPEANVSEKLLEIATSLDLKPYMNRKIGDLSLAVRRKVSVAISLITYNKVLVLDEPTKGVPAKDRRIIWNVLRYARFCGKTVIFSSNENLECETLADLIIVIDDGELLAIGSPQYLRQKYTRGFFFELKILSDGKTEEETYENLERDVENVIQFAYFLHEDSQLL